MKDTKRAKIIAFMKANGEISQRDAIYLGSYRLASQIFALKEQGYVIESNLREVENADGTKSRVAFYSLLSEPQREADNDSV